MKKLFLLFMFLLSFASFAQTEANVEFLNDGKICQMKDAFTLSTASTVYSSEFRVSGYWPRDSVQVVPILWSATDTTVATITLEGKQVSGNESAWTALATVVTNYNTSGNDSLVTKLLYLYNANSSAGASAGKQVSLAGYCPDRVRVKVVYTNKTTVGNSGNFKVWLKLKKQY